MSRRRWSRSTAKASASRGSSPHGRAVSSLPAARRTSTATQRMRRWQRTPRRCMPPPRAIPPLPIGHSERTSGTWARRRPTPASWVIERWADDQEPHSMIPWLRRLTSVWCTAIHKCLVPTGTEKGDTCNQRCKCDHLAVIWRVALLVLVALGLGACSEAMSAGLSQHGHPGNGHTISPSKSPRKPATPYVTSCGTSLCFDGSTWIEKGGTGYGQYDTPSTLVAEAQSGKLNTIELVEFDTRYHQLSDAESAATWNRLDQVIADARNAGLHVVLNLSEFGQSLQAAGYTMSSASWQPEWNQYLSFIASRTNTVTGV